MENPILPRPTRRWALASIAALASMPALAAPDEPKPPTPDEVAALAAPALPDVWLGEASAPVTFIEYASMTCSHCAAFHRETLPEIRKRLVDTGKARYTLREFPLDPLAVAAAMLARCRGPERFHETASALFGNQASWAFTGKPLDAIREEAARLGIDEAAFGACIKDQALYDGVLASRRLASERLGVTSTPTLFVNGRRHVGGVSPDGLDALVRPYL